MNKSKFFLAVLIYSMYAFTFQHAIAQIKIDKCGTDEYLKQQLKSDPTLQSKLLLNEKYIQKWIQENYHPDSNSVITIPIVVHVVYNTDEQNISDQRIFDQIAIINRDYSGHNYHSMGLFSNVLKANTGIQFCLAHKAPDGKLTTGIERKKTNIASFIMNDSVKFYNNGGLNAWDPTKYFNIWVCK